MTLVQGRTHSSGSDPERSEDERRGAKGSVSVDRLLRASRATPDECVRGYT